MRKPGYYFTALILILMVFSCKKNSDDSPQGSYFRLVHVEIYYDTLHALSFKYKYAEEKLTESIIYFVQSNDSLTPSGKSEFHYPAYNSFVKTNFRYLDEKWEITSNEIIKHDAGKWLKYISYDSNNVEKKINNYYYENGLISKKEEYKAKAGENHPYLFTYYSWQGNNPSSVKKVVYIDDTISYTIIDTVIIENGKVVKTESLGNCQGFFCEKTEFEYIGNNISSRTIYVKSPSGWEYYCDIDYKYDIYDNLIQITENSESHEYTYYYFYENSLGNLSLVKGYETEWIYLLAPYPAGYSFLMEK